MQEIQEEQEGKEPLVQTQQSVILSSFLLLFPLFLVNGETSEVGKNRMCILRRE